MRRTALALLAGLAIATTISAPASAMTLSQAIASQAADVLFHGYKVKDLNLIERRKDGKLVIELPDGQRVVTPSYEIHTDHDDPYGPCGAFFMEVKAGTKSICVFEGPQVGMTVNAVYETVDGGTTSKDVCNVTQKSIIKPRSGPRGYDIDRDDFTVDGSCSKKP